MIGFFSLLGLAALTLFAKADETALSSEYENYEENNNEYGYIREYEFNDDIMDDSNNEELYDLMDEDEEGEDEYENEENADEFIRFRRVGRGFTNFGHRIARGARNTWSRIIRSRESKDAAKNMEKWGKEIKKNGGKVIKQIKKIGTFVPRAVTKLIRAIKAIRLKDGMYVAAYLLMEKAKLKRVCAWAGKLEETAKKTIKKVGRFGRTAINALKNGRTYANIGKAVFGSGFGTTWIKGVNFIANTARHVNRHVTRFGRHVGRFGGRVGRSIGRTGRRVVRRVGRFGRNVGRTARRTVRNVGRTARRTVRNVGRTARRTVRNVGRAARRTVRRVGRSIRRAFRGWDDANLKNSDNDFYSKINGNYNYENNNDKDAYYRRRGRRLSEKELLDNWESDFNNDLLKSGMSLNDDEKFNTEMINEILESERSSGVSLGLRRLLKDPNLSAIEKTERIRRRLRGACSLKKPDAIIDRLIREWKPLTDFMRKNEFWDFTDDDDDNDDMAEKEMSYENNNDNNNDNDNEYKYENNMGDYDKDVSNDNDYNYYKYRRLITNTFDEDATEYECKVRNRFRHGAIKLVAIVGLGATVNLAIPDIPIVATDGIGGAVGYGLVLDLTNGYLAHIIEFGGGVTAGFGVGTGTSGITVGGSIGLGFGWAKKPADWYGAAWAREIGVTWPLPVSTVSADITLSAGVWGGFEPFGFGGVQATVALGVAKASTDPSPKFTLSHTGGAGYALCLLCQQVKQCSCARPSCWYTWEDNETCWRQRRWDDDDNDNDENDYDYTQYIEYNNENDKQNYDYSYQNNQN